MREQGVMWLMLVSIYICECICMYVCMYVCIIYVTTKSLNGILAVDSPFQILTVDFSLNL